MNESLIADRYRLTERIAIGGMGEVWRGVDERLGRPVAVKLIQESLAHDPSVAERFRREAQAAGAISSPHLVNILDYVEQDGRPGIVMELVEAETLADRIARTGPLPVDAAVGIVRDVLDGLQTAHNAGVVHRDLKPSNILVTPAGKAKVGDFGIARATTDATLTATGAVIGTPHYAAPEQVLGRNATPQTDLYAVGVTLYEALTGVRPFDADTQIATAMVRLTEDPAPPRTHRADLPPAVEAVVMRALAREPGDRFASASDMAAALERALIAPHDPAAALGTPPANGDAPVVAPPVVPLADAATAPDPGDRTAVLPIGDETVALPRRQPEPRRRPRSAQRRSHLDPRLAIPVVIAALLVAALLFGGLALLGGPDTVAVPAFRGERVEDARRMAQAAGIVVKLRTVDDIAAEGVVVRQNVPAGTRVEEGSEVVLSVSSGEAPCCVVPPVAGLTLDEARAVLEETGLVVGDVERRPSDEPPGTVLEAFPAEGVEVDPDTPIDLAVAAPREERGEGNDRGGDKDEEKGEGKGKGKDDD